MSLILRRDKGSALTRDELDDNLEYLEQNGGGGGVKSLHYIASLEQTGTDAPVATVLRNDFDGDVVWSKSELGIDGLYIATLTGAFTGHVRIIPPNNISSADSVTRQGYGAGSDNDNEVYLNSFSIINSTGESTPAHGLLFGAGYSYIEIIKYLD